MTTVKHQICIIGAGRLGQAFATMLQRQDECAVTIWDRDGSLAANQPPLEQQLSAAEVVIMAVPTNALAEVIVKIIPLLPPSAGLLFVSKGLDQATGLTAVETARAQLPQTRAWAMLGGAMIAEELNAGIIGTGIIAGDPELIKTVKSIFPAENMTIEVALDPQEVALGGVIKNIYAFAFGLGVGLKWAPEKLQGWWNACERELVATAIKVGLSEELISGPAGLGDFQMTAGSPHSRNRQAGVVMATEQKIDSGAEAVNAWPNFWARFTQLHDQPILAGLNNIFNQVPVAQVLNSTFSSIINP